MSVHGDFMILTGCRGLLCLLKPLAVRAGGRNHHEFNAGLLSCSHKLQRVASSHAQRVERNVLRQVIMAVVSAARNAPGEARYRQNEYREGVVVVHAFLL